MTTETETTRWRHFEIGDYVRVRDLPGAYRIARIGSDAGGIWVSLIGVGRGAHPSRTIDPQRREMIDRDAQFSASPEPTGGGEPMTTKTAKKTAAKKTQPVANGETAARKKCGRCSKTKAAEKFYRNKASRDGLSGWCRDCNAAHRKG